MQQLVREECFNRNKWPFYVLEIGSWAGGSAITWAEAIKAYNNRQGLVVCVDPWKPYFDPGKYESALYFRMHKALSTGAIFNLFVHNITSSKHDDIVLPFRGSCEDAVFFLADKKFDLIFVDGDHSYSSVLNDLKNCCRLVADGGILCGDDLEMQIFQVDEIYARRNREVDFILDPKTKRWFHPGCSVAIGEFFGEVSVWEGFWAMRKCGDEWESVILEEAALQHLVVPNHLANAQ
ncbi:class I SAM-dependent methyltransferase [Candidatus Poribacteria bacterium]|nr:class I SAM-dependent methyltransferase [Candidatus Poribacteria bacterium]